MSPDLQDARIQDLCFKNDRRSSEDTEEESKRIDEVGVHLPIKDGLNDDGRDTLSEEEDGDDQSRIPGEDPDAITDEERELPGRLRPPRGAGWWGRGRPLQPHRKGLKKDFVNGAGLPSPGRWRIRVPAILR